MVLVAVQVLVLGLYRPPVFNESVREVARSAPDDHFAAGPHCRVTTVGAEGALVMLVAVQTIGAGIVSPASIKDHAAVIISRPRRSFHCRSKLPCDARRARGRIGGAGSCPTVRSRIISPAGIK